METTEHNLLELFDRQQELINGLANAIKELNSCVLGLQAQITAQTTLCQQGYPQP